MRARRGGVAEIRRITPLPPRQQQQISATCQVGANPHRKDKLRQLPAGAGGEAAQPIPYLELASHAAQKLFRPLSARLGRRQRAFPQTL